MNYNVGYGHGLQSRLRSWTTIFSLLSFKRLPHIFVPALTASEILIFLTFDLQKVDQGHRVQFMQLYHSIANAKYMKDP